MASKKDDKKEHRVRAIAIARLYCTCGWYSAPEKVNGVPDGILAEQMEYEFLQHQQMARELDK